MCGIAGFIKTGIAEKNITQVKKMVSLLNHRGPDEAGLLITENACLGHTRLSIIDLSTGSQPIHNEDRTLWIVYNGEVFNYPELREILIKKGHRFTTTSDTEVILHGYEEFGPNILNKLNGQFSFAIWNTKKQKLFCARDRVGIRPFFYFFDNEKLIFSSEIKAILGTGEVNAEIDIDRLQQMFTFWCTLPNTTVFKNIHQLPPGYYLEFEKKELKIHRYWQLGFPEKNNYENRSEAQIIEEFRELLIDASIIRLRADVPVGAYLSGGLDSSIITSIIKNHTTNSLETFSISFAEREFDEKNYQQMMISHLNTNHQNFEINNELIAANFLRTIWHTEAPIYRTAPIPMMLLSALVRRNARKVVLTGEGADEFLGGYNIFKETLIRQFWARQPESKIRPMLFQKLYPYLKASSTQNRQFMIKFFSRHLTEVDNPLYSHLLRWENNANLLPFVSEELKNQTTTDMLFEQYKQLLPDNFMKWAPFCRAQYIEIEMYMSNYLLSSQGDRMGMANSVEGRYPFLDHRIIEFASKIPPHFKSYGLNEKYLLKKAFSHLLPAEITHRNKQPYRAPMASSFFKFQNPDLNEIIDLMQASGKSAATYFNTKAVESLLKKWKRLNGKLTSERENNAFILLLSTLALDRLFISDKSVLKNVTLNPDINIIYQKENP